MGLLLETTKKTELVQYAVPDDPYWSVMLASNIAMLDHCNGLHWFPV